MTEPPPPPPTQPPPTQPPPPSGPPTGNAGASRRKRWALLGAASVVGLVTMLGVVLGIRYLTDSEAGLQRTLERFSSDEQVSFVIDVTTSEATSTVSVVRAGEEYAARLEDPDGVDPGLTLAYRPGEEAELLAQFTDVEGYLASLGGDPAEADLSQVDEAWFTADRKEYLDWTWITRSVSFDLEGPWTEGAYTLAETGEEREFDGDEATGYELKWDVARLRENLDDLSIEEQDRFVGHFIFRMSADDFDDLAESYVEGREEFNEQNVTFWMDGNRLVAITAPELYSSSHEEFTVRFTDVEGLPDPSGLSVAEDDVLSRDDYEGRIRQAIFGLEGDDADE